MPDNLHPACEKGFVESLHVEEGQIAVDLTRAASSAIMWRFRLSRLVQWSASYAVVCSFVTSGWIGGPLKALHMSKKSPMVRTAARD